MLSIACAKYFSKHFSLINSFNLHNNPEWWVLLLPLWYKEGSGLRVSYPSYPAGTWQSWHSDQDSLALQSMPRALTSLLQEGGIQSQTLASSTIFHTTDRHHHLMGLCLLLLTSQESRRGQPFALAGGVPVDLSESPFSRMMRPWVACRRSGRGMRG